MRYIFLLALLLPSALLAQQQQNPASPQQPSEQTDEAGQTSAESSAAPAAAGSPAPQAAPAQPPQQSNQAQPSSASRPGGLSFRFRGASLHEFIDVVAKSLKINYILDPSVGDGAVTINTYGHLRRDDLLPLLQGDPKNPWSGRRPSGQPLPHRPLSGGVQVAHFSTVGRRS